MFSQNKTLSAYSKEEIEEAKTRYFNAISTSVKGTGMVLLKREVKDIFTNGYNPKIMRLHQANHDIQIVIDQFACAQYVCGYLTKNEGGISKLLKAVNDDFFINLSPGCFQQNHGINYVYSRRLI